MTSFSWFALINCALPLTANLLGKMHPKCKRGRAAEAVGGWVFEGLCLNFASEAPNSPVTAAVSLPRTATLLN